MNLRLAVTEDIPFLLDYGQEYWDSTPYAGTGMPYDEDAYSMALEHMINNEYFIVIEDEEVIVGFLSAVVQPVALNPNYIMAQEIFWYVDPDQRGKGIAGILRNRYESDMKDIGVAFVTMQDMTSSTDLASYLLDNDYALTERVFAKVI